MCWGVGVVLSVLIPYSSVSLNYGNKTIKSPVSYSPIARQEEESENETYCELLSKRTVVLNEVVRRSK